MIIVCEPIRWGLEHSPCNAGLLATMRLAYPTTLILFYGEESHVNHVRNQIGTEIASSISWKTLRIPPRYSRFFERFWHDLKLMRQILNRVQSWSPWHARHYREAFRSVRGVYAISESALQHFLDVFGEFLLPETVIEVIHNGVDTGRFRPAPEVRKAARDWLGLPQEALVLGSVGRLHKQKQPWVLVSVFAELKRVFPTLFLVLVGTGPLEQELRRQVEALGVQV